MGGEEGWIGKGSIKLVSKVELGRTQHPSDVEVKRWLANGKMLSWNTTFLEMNIRLLYRS